MRIGVVIFAIAASAFIGPSGWASLCIRDQFQENQNYGYAVGYTTLMAQTFTAGLTGTLCHIEIGNTTDGTVWFSTSAPVVQIRDTTVVEGQIRPGSNILGTVTWPTIVPTGDWTQPISFLAKDIDITEGNTYSIVLWATGYSGTVAVGAMNTESYAGGALWAWGDWDDDYETPDTWGLLSTSDIGVFDMQFRTFVVPVPLPAGVWLGICAVGVAGWHLKRLRG